MPCYKVSVNQRESTRTKSYRYRIGMTVTVLAKLQFEAQMSNLLAPRYGFMLMSTDGVFFASLKSYSICLLFTCFR